MAAAAAAFLYTAPPDYNAIVVTTNNGHSNKMSHSKSLFVPTVKSFPEEIPNTSFAAMYHVHRLHRQRFRSTHGTDMMIIPHGKKVPINLQMQRHIFQGKNQLRFEANARLGDCWMRHHVRLKTSSSCKSALKSCSKRPCT
jgi:hypothetical protein